MKKLIRQFRLLDADASIITGVCLGLVFYLLLLFVVPLFDGGNASIMMRWCASFILGKSVLAPPASFDVVYCLAGLCACMIQMMAWTFVMNFILHRGGVWIGLFGGAFFGLLLFAIVFYQLDSIYPWLVTSRTCAMMSVYILVSALAGFTYEILEIEDQELEGAV